MNLRPHSVGSETTMQTPRERMPTSIVKGRKALRHMLHPHSQLRSSETVNEEGEPFSLEKYKLYREVDKSRLWKKAKEDRYQERRRQLQEENKTEEEIVHILGPGEVKGLTFTRKESTDESVKNKRVKVKFHRNEGEMRDYEQERVCARVCDACLIF